MMGFGYEDIIAENLRLFTKMAILRVKGIIILKAVRLRQNGK
jgi:hypothetical protein